MCWFELGVADSKVRATIAAFDPNPCFIERKPKSLALSSHERPKLTAGQLVQYKNSNWAYAVGREPISDEGQKANLPRYIDGTKRQHARK